MLDQVTPEAGAFYVVDKAYTDFARLHRLHCAGAFFITRAKREPGLRRPPAERGRRPVGGGRGGQRPARPPARPRVAHGSIPTRLRLIRYVDPETGKRLKFLTNNLTLPAATVALLYRKRWRIELFFKWVKQHLHVKAFFGTTPNAVQTQLWIAVIVFVLVVRLKHRYQLTQETNEILQILGLTILEKTPVSELFSEFHRKTDPDENTNQLSLFV